MKQVVGFLEAPATWQFSVHPAVIRSDRSDTLTVPMYHVSKGQNSRPYEMTGSHFDERVAKQQARRLRSPIFITDEASPASVLFIGRKFSDLIAQQDPEGAPYFNRIVERADQFDDGYIRVMAAADAYDERTRYARDLALRAWQDHNPKLAPVARTIDPKDSDIAALVWDTYRQSHDVAAAQRTFDVTSEHLRNFGHPSNEGDVLKLFAHIIRRYRSERDNRTPKQNDTTFVTAIASAMKLRHAHAH